MIRISPVLVPYPLCIFISEIFIVFFLLLIPLQLIMHTINSTLKIYVLFGLILRNVTFQDPHFILK